MDRFSDLEKAWEAKQRRRNIVFGIFVLTAILSYIAYTYFLSHHVKIHEPETTQKAGQEVLGEQAPAIKEPAPVMVKDAESPKKQEESVENEKILYLTLDKSFDASIKKMLYEVEKEIKTPHEQETSDTEADGEIAELPQEEPAASTAVLEKEAIAPSDMAAVYIEEFLLEQTYEKALKIANYYFQGEQYQKAIKWSLTANKINSADDESWIVFANSSIALGMQEQAKKALGTYLLKRDSIRVRELYNKIK